MDVTSPAFWSSCVSALKGSISCHLARILPGSHHGGFRDAFRDSETVKRPSEKGILRKRVLDRPSDASSNLKDKGPLKQVTIEELRSANTPERIWVYDLTSFSYRHPGGRDFILIAAGKDVTTLFETSHGPIQERILRKYLIGELVSQDMPSFPRPDAFAVTLKKRIREYFETHSIDPKHSPLSYCRYFVTLCLIVGTFLLQLRTTETSYTFYGLAVVLGLLQAEWAVSAIHDCAHGAVGHNPNFWRLTVASHDFINGSSGILWIYQHVVSHHIYTNVDGCDVDIQTEDADFRRIKHSQQWAWVYRFQWLYAPAIYVFLACSVRIYDIVVLFKGKRGPITVNPFTTAQKMVFWGGKAFHILSRIIYPLCSTSISTRQLLLSYLVTDFVFSLFLAIIFQSSHVVEDVSWPKPNPETGNMDIDWSRLQVETAQDYAHDQPITTFLTGALNYQVVHHLVPYVAQPYLRELAPIVRETTKEFGVKYKIQGTLWSAIGGHLGLLKMMGTPPHSH